jgi:hypothetical protein
MATRKAETIREQLGRIEKRLSDAEEYLARGVNVEGSGFLHLDDWRGKSGHPLWVRNFMIPTTLKNRSRKEKTLDLIDKKAKDRATTRHRRIGRMQDPSLLRD